MFCGPDALAQPAPKPASVHAGWTGFDRDLGARKREERARRAEEEQRQARARARRSTWLGSAAAAVLVFAGAGYLWWSGALSTPLPVPEAPAPLMTELRKPASPARTDLALYARSLQELAGEAQKKLLATDEVNAKDVARFRSRLDSLHTTGRALEPQLTREESRVLTALQRAEVHLAAFLKSFEGSSPDLTGTEAQVATEQIARALSVLRGDKVDDIVVTYAKKASTAAALQKQLDQP